MKKHLLKSLFLLCALVVGSNAWADDYALYSGTITEGDYIIVYDGRAMKNTVSSNRLGYKDVSPLNDKITSTDAAIEWHIAKSGDYWTIYNADVSKYAASTGSNNQAKLETDITDNSKWTVTGTETYEFENLARANASSNNKWLRRNGTYGFACYTSSTGGALSLYKKVVSTGQATTVTIDAAGITNTDVSAGTAAGTLSATVKDASSNTIGSASVTWSSSKPAVATINETTGAVTLVKKGSTTITASYAGIDGTYQSSSNTYVLNVTNSAANDGSSAHPFTPSEARDAYDADEIDAETDYYVTGIIQSVGSYSSTDKALSYWISDDGTTTNRMQCYKGKGLSGADFDSADDLEVGDIVTVKGKIKLYNSTFEFDEGNQITAMTVRTKVNLATLTFSPTSLVVGSATTSQATGTIDQPSCTTAILTYESLDADIATCTSAGVITPVAKGTARIKVTLSVPANDPSYKLGTVKTKLENITIANPSHTAQFSINGVIDNGNDETVEEGDPITFPANPAAILGKSFVGWTTAAINGNQNSAPATLVTSANMGNADIIYYAVFAKASLGTVNASLTINKDTENFPEAYGNSNKFTEYTLEGKTFKIQQAYVNGSKLQWRAEGNSNGTGTMYNTEILDNIQSIVLTYDNSDSYKNFNLKVGSEENPTSGTAITPSANGNIYTFDCSASDYDYFVLANGSNAGYLTSIKINYKAEGTVYSAYCTTVVPDEPTTPDVDDVAHTVTLTTTANMAGWRTFAPVKDNQNYTADADVYYVSAAGSSSVTLVKIDGGVPANTPVILHQTSGTTITLTETTNDITAPGASNLLAVSTAGQNLGTVYRLGYKSAHGVGFYTYTTTSAPAGIVYINPSSPGHEFLGLDFDEETTGVADITNTNLTNNTNEFYNLAGQRVTQPTKGLYIVNGKKVIIK